MLSDRFIWRTPMAIFNLLTHSVPSTLLTASAEIELLKQQLQFLQDTNGSLIRNFNAYADLYNKLLIGLGVVLGIAAAWATYFYGKTLKESKEQITGIVSREVEKAVQQYVQTEVDTLRRLLERESAIDRVSIDYILPKGAIQETPEHKMLRDRGFQIAPIRYGIESYRLSREVTVIDFVNGGYSDDEIKQSLATLSPQLQSSSIIVIYVGKPISEIFNLKEKTLFFTPANTTITLVGAVASAAAIALTRKTIE
jgi:hypothetical protein